MRVRNGLGPSHDDDSGGETCAEVDAAEKAAREAADQSNDPRINEFIYQMSIRAKASKQMIGAFAVGSAVVGATGGVACYFLCSGASVTTLGLSAGTYGAAAAPILYKSGDIIEEFIPTSQGAIKVVGQVVVDGTKLTIKDVRIFSAENGEKVSVGARALLDGIKPLLGQLKDAGYTSIRILGSAPQDTVPAAAEQIRADPLILRIL